MLSLSFCIMRKGEKNFRMYVKADMRRKHNARQICSRREKDPHSKEKNKKSDHSVFS